MSKSTRFKHPYGATHYVLPRPGVSPSVKEADFFCTQGGHLDDWGKSWIPIIADGLHHARLLAYFIGSGTLFPNSVGFSPPNTKTVLELREDEFPFLWELQGERVHD